MKQTFTLFLSCFFLLSFLHAQRIVYRYDAAGNRTARIIEYNSQPQLAAMQPQEPQHYEDHMFPDKSVVIYPNPTRGQVTVEIQNYDAETVGNISISTVNGRLLQRADISGSHTPLDIGSQPDGMYLFSITIDGQTSTWKILKK